MYPVLVRLVFGLCRSRNRLMKAYPDNVREIGFLAALARTAPYRPWFAALGATAKVIQPSLVDFLR